jgi:hypothetical protein
VPRKRKRQAIQELINSGSLGKASEVIDFACPGSRCPFTRWAFFTGPVKIKMVQEGRQNGGAKNQNAQKLYSL